jgi:GntR family transcriptional regulator
MIDPDDFLPRYYQLANILRESIANGKFEAHQPIPSERQLEGLYSVSRTTIRQAIELLIRQGFLYREHGRGTFVSPQKLQKGISELTSFTEDMKRRGIVPGQTILGIAQVRPSAGLRGRLELPGDRMKALRIERLRLGDGRSVILKLIRPPSASSRAWTAASPVSRTSASMRPPREPGVAGWIFP